MGALIDKPLLGLKSLYHQACVEDAPAAVTCDYVAACSAIYKVDALKRSGIMNPQYFVLWDDIELSTVIRLSGYTIHAISAAIAYHHFEFKGANLTFPHYYSLRNKIYYFTKFLSDAEFVQFPEMLTKRFYRMMVCGKDNIPVISTYMHALNDGLNGIMGKADDYKIVTLPNEKKWHGILKGKRSIVIRFDPAFITLKTLLVDLEAFCDAKITIVSGGTSLSNVTLGRAVSIVEQAVAGDYDLEIFTCCHVLDFSYESIAFTEGGTLVIDNYGNTAADCGDVASYRRQEENYAVFRAMLYKYIKDKLCAVREHYKQC
jgi:hypothetical protein